MMLWQMRVRSESMLPTMKAALRPRRLVALLVLAALLGFSRNPAFAQLTAESLTASSELGVGPYLQDVEDAIRRFQNKDFDGARSLLKMAREKAPKLAPPEIIMAQLFSLAEQPALVRAELERAIDTYPKDPEAYIILAETALNEGSLTAATQLYSSAGKATEAFNDNPKRKKNFQLRVYSGSALIDENKKNWTGARDNLLNFLKIDPDNVMAHQRLGRAQFQLGDAKEAYKEFLAITKLDPKQTPPEIVLATFYKQSGDTASADKWVDTMIKRGATNPAAQLALARWMLDANRLQEAQTYADEAVKLDPDSLEAKTARGIVERMRKDYKAAQADLEAVHLQAPENGMANNHLALVLIEQKDDNSHRRALDFADLNVKLNPKSPEAFATLGWIHYRSGRSSQAREDLKLITAGGSNLSVESAYYAATILYDHGNPADALKLLDAALSSEGPFAYRKEATELQTKLQKAAGKTPSEGKKPAATPAPAKDEPAKGDAKGK